MTALVTMKNTIFVSIVEKTIAGTPVLLGHAEFEVPDQALEWVNQQAEEWIEKNKDGKYDEFEIDGIKDDDMIKFNKLTDELLITANSGEEMWMACINAEAIQELNVLENSGLLTGNNLVMLTPKEVEALREKLQLLVNELEAGVDLWLAPGGTVNVNSEDVFIDCDEPCVEAFQSILEKLK